MCIKILNHKYFHYNNITKSPALQVNASDFSVSIICKPRVRARCARKVFSRGCLQIRKCSCARFRSCGVFRRSRNRFRKDICIRA